MVTFLSTSAKTLRCRTLATSALALALGAPFLHAGSIITLTNGSEIDGKLSVAGPAIHSDSQASQPDTQVTDVLESTFGDAPFALNIFHAGKINQLPPNWTAQDIGDVVAPGSVTVKDGTFTVIGSGNNKREHGPGKDHFFYVCVPWPDDGQFTTRLASLDGQGEDPWSGIHFRDSLDPQGADCAAVLNGQGQIRMPFRHEAHKDDWGTSTNGDAPIWLRFTHRGNTIFISTSADGNDWNIVDERPFKTIDNPLVGLASHCFGDKSKITSTFDNVSLTPLPSSAQVLPAGVLLQGGSILAGHFNHLSFDPSAGDNNGEFERGDKKMEMARSSIAAIVSLPIERSQLADFSSKTGILMRNGDTMDGDVTEVSRDQVSVSSVLLGLTTYRPGEVRAAFVAPQQTKPGTYEVRLRDGSILNATAVSGDANEIVITDVSGVTIQADQDEIAQIRAGSAVVQNLAQLDWKATSPNAPAAPAPAPAANPAAAANNAGAPVANPAPATTPPLVDSWLGKDQQQILETGIDTLLEFPLPGKFRAFGTQVAVSADSPPNATATIRILVNGQELAKTPPFRVGDAPRFLELSLPSAAHITLQAQSIFPGTKVLYLDPVAIRQ